MAELKFDEPVCTSAGPRCPENPVHQGDPSGYFIEPFFCPSLRTILVESGRWRYTCRAPGNIQPSATVYTSTTSATGGSVLIRTV